MKNSSYNDPVYIVMLWHWHMMLCKMFRTMDMLNGKTVQIGTLGLMMCDDEDWGN